MQSKVDNTPLKSSNKRLERLKEIASLLPHLPGVYQYLNADGEVIYVGKAKDLRRRVTSYFLESSKQSSKVQVMVKHICDIKHIVVDSENDALLLENSLIKTLQPRYNILLKDDKSYPWVAILNEHFPRIVSTRQLKRDGTKYFGPYSSIVMQRSVLEFIREIIPLRTCKLKLSPEAIASGKYGICMQYHLGNCNAPCIGAQSAEQYEELVAMATSVLKGDLRPVRKYLEKEMFAASDKLEFEIAQQYKQRLTAIENYAHRSVIVSSKIVHTDVFSLLLDGDTALCNFVRIRYGSVVAVYTVQLSQRVDTPPEEMLTFAIQHIVEKIAGGTLAREVIVPFLPSGAILFNRSIFTVPKRGDKYELLAFSKRCAQKYRAEQIHHMEQRNPERHTNRLMEAMKSELHLDKEPRHIECFDNSNLQGTNPVASCVVFRNGKPSKSEYRHYNIKTVVGADDFASMREIIARRYTRQVEEGAELPDLIIVDGGKGQLSSAYEVLKDLQLEDKIPIVGLAKRIEEIFYPNDGRPYYLSRLGEPLKVVCHIRDEAHRFGITFHRQKRSGSFIKSELDDIDGIGTKSASALMKRFKTISNIKKASLDDLCEVIGKDRAEKVMRYFSPED
ncbi:MAG: excinuclease ABC subunit UvrC [Rikenellaceae bacterium]